MDVLRIGGRGLEARWWRAARPAAPPIVCLHDGLGSVSTWREFPADVAARLGRDVVAYSRLGHGQSDQRLGPPDVAFMHHEGVTVLPAVLDAAGIRRAVLFGHSDGGSIALLAAAAHPERVIALVLEAPHLFVEALTVASITAVRERYLAEDGELRRRLARHHAAVDHTFYGWADVWLSPAFRSWSIEAEAAHTTCPILALQGLDDEFGTPAQVHRLAALTAGRTTVELIQKCGHSPHRDQSSLVLDRLEAFMAHPHG
ncbi:MAG: alpha/beta fold hydrolase [Vicinamibacterales bacterium]